MNTVGTVSEQLDTYKSELNAELGHILDYWINHAQDTVDGGFYGKVKNDNHPVADAPKGSVLNARILWSFSSAYNLTGKKEYLKIADRAYRYIGDHVIDKNYEGVYWTVDHLGKKLDAKKQVYASAFTIYAFSEYYKASGQEEVLTQAIDLYKLLVDKSFDRDKTGYLEAFTEDWQPISIARGLSALMTMETPAMRPPPPIDPTTISTSGSCSRISVPTVPCPAITKGSAKAWIKTRPVLTAIF